MNAEIRPDRATLVAFAGTVLIGGTNFVAVKFTVEELAPLWGAGVRFASAAVLLLLIGVVMRKQLPRGRAFGGAVLYGVLSFGLAYALLYIALKSANAGTVSVMMAGVPLATLLLAVAHGQEKISARGVAGGVFAIAGIALLSLNRLNADLPIVPLLLTLGAVLAAAESTVLVKGFPKADPITTNAVGMIAASLVLILGSAALSEPWVLPETARVWGAMIWLVIAGSIGLFVLYLTVVRRWIASATTYSLTMMPLVAVTLGALFAGETVSKEVVGGAALVILGVYVGALRKQAVNPAEVKPSPQAPAIEEI